MDSLLAMRHSAEHVLTMAMKKLYGDKVIMAMGPATEEGFYFDFDHPEDFSVSEEQFPAIEKEMESIIRADIPFVQKNISVEEARKLFKDNPYKQEWLDEINQRGEKVSVYYTGNFVDLCLGAHVASTGKVGPFKLLSIAGAYWRGSEKNKMLTRIYGTCFPTKKELDKYIKLQAEAKARDHRVIGKKLGLFAFADLVGQGLPLLTPKGATIRRILERFIVDEELRRGYLHVVTPPLAKTDLYRTSGHYPYYKDTMYPPMKMDEDELILRPMTCPHHFMLYKSEPRSYRDLPIRYAELSPQFRYEKSGELTGLMRVRMFTLADAHILATIQQASDEINAVLDLIDFVNKTLGMKKGEDYRYRLSLGDRFNTTKYYKDDAAWDYAEEVLKTVLNKRDAPSFTVPNEAAFYGPKIDVQIRNIAGKEETAFTVQYDFVMPKRFKLTYIDSDGKEKQPIVIHRSSLGAFERTMAFLIEKYAGAFPLWLAPVQVALIPIAERHIEAAKKAADYLKAAGIRVELDDRNNTMQGKIRNHTLQKVPYMGIIGDREVKENTVSVRTRSGEDLKGMTLEQFLAQLKNEIEAKS